MQPLSMCEEYRVCRACGDPLPATPAYFRSDPYTGKLVRRTCRTCESEQAAARSQEKKRRWELVAKWAKGMHAYYIRRREPASSIQCAELVAILQLQDYRCYLTGTKMVTPPKKHNGLNWKSWLEGLPGREASKTIVPVKLYGSKTFEAGNVALVCQCVIPLCQAFNGALPVRRALENNMPRDTRLSKAVLREVVRANKLDLRYGKKRKAAKEQK